MQTVQIDCKKTDQRKPNDFHNTSLLTIVLIRWEIRKDF